MQYCTDIQPKDLVAIYGRPPAESLIREVYREVVRAGGFAYTFLTLDGLEQIFYSDANQDQLTHVSPISKMVYGEFDALIAIQSESNTRSLSNVDPKNQSMRAKAHSEIMQVFMDRGASGDLKWCGTLFPTDAYAQDAEMSLEEFEDYVYGTTYADAEDPVGEWMAIRKEQQRLVDWLVGKREVVARGPNIDMRFSIEGRSFENADGRKNMPSGEIFTGPVEDSVNGWVRFTYPAVDYGREIDGVELHFEAGKVVKASAEKNQDFLLAQLDTDEGSRYLGEWAIGTNKKIDRFIKNILFDEKIGGTIHMALGSGYPETGSQNKSAIHMDMICEMRDGGQILVDDELIYESGEFNI